MLAGSMRTAVQAMSAKHFAGLRGAASQAGLASDALRLLPATCVRGGLRVFAVLDRTGVP